MSVRVNLAPEVYQSSQRNKRLRKLATTIGVIVSVISLGLVVAGLVIVGGEKVAIAQLQKQINDKQTKVTSYTELADAVTIQEHLNSLTTLRKNQVQYSRFFSVLEEVSPLGIAAGNVAISMDNSVELSGTAKSYDLVTKLAKSLEASNASAGGAPVTNSPVTTGTLPSNVAGGSTATSSTTTATPYFANVTIASVSADSIGVSFKLTTKMSSEVTQNGN